MRSKMWLVRFGLVLLLAGVVFLGQGWRAPHPARAAVTTKIKIMPLGDSITSGTGAYSSYRCELLKSLVSAYSVSFVGSVYGQWGILDYKNTPPPSYCTYPNSDWYEEGHSGYDIPHILSGAPSWPGNLQSWLKAANPDVVLVHLGTNNFSGNPDFPPPNVGNAINQLGQVIDTLRAANPFVRILLAQILPCSCDSLHMIPQFNALIPGLAASKDRPYSPIVVVDMYTDFPASEFQPDGVHPNKDGENRMAVRWKAGFDQIMAINVILDKTYIPQVVK